MSESADSRDVRRLIELYYIRPLTSDEFQTLQTALRQRKEYRDAFRHAGRFEAELRWLVESDATDDKQTQAGSSEFEPPAVHLSADVGSRRTRGQMKRPVWFGSVAGRTGMQWAVVAALVLSAWLGGRYVRWPLGGVRQAAGVAQIDTDEIEPSDKSEAAAGAETGRRGDPLPLGEVTASHEARFERFDITEELTVGVYQLLEGAVAIRLKQGVRLAITGPAEFELLSTMRMRVGRGSVRAFVPEAGQGFTVETPDGEIVDLGTEFGVVVAEDRPNELHVFAGEVRYHDDSDGPRRVVQDEAVAWNAGQAEVLAGTDEQAFTTPAEIGYNQWKRYSAKLRDDPSVLLYLDFADAAASDVAERSATPAVSMVDSAADLVGNIESRVLGCYPGIGRWRQKPALIFERPGDRVELNVPGEYEQVSMLIWLQVNRFEQALQAVFNTRDWDEGEHHWNLLRDGVSRVGVSGGYAASCTQAAVAVGQWTLLAATLDAESGVATYYVNGAQVDRIRWQGAKRIRFGRCCLGAHGTTSGLGQPAAYGRELRGRVDEFVLLSRKLSAEEIAAHYQAGCDF